MKAVNELARFLPELERPDFRAGSMQGGEETEPGVLTMPYASYSHLVQSFVETAYGNGWVLSDFDWSSWAQSAEARLLRDDEVALSKATFEQLCRILTVCIRADRFSEGALFDAFESGLILRIVRRAAALAEDDRHGQGSR